MCRAAAQQVLCRRGSKRGGMQWGRQRAAGLLAADLVQHPKSYRSPCAHPRARTAESMSEKMTAGRDISRHSCDCPERPHTRTASAAHTLGRAAATAQADLEIFKLLRVVSAAFRKPVRACFSYVNENLKPLIFFFLSLFWSSIPFSIYYYISPSKLQNKLQNVGVIHMDVTQMYKLCIILPRPVLLHMKVCTRTTR